MIVTFPCSILEGVKREVDSIVDISHDINLIIDHEIQPVVEFHHRTHPQDYLGFTSFYSVYGSIKGQVSVMVLRYSMYLEYTEVRSGRDKNKEKK